MSDSSSSYSPFQGVIPNDFYAFFIGMSIVNALIALIAACLNVLVILTFIKRPSLQTPSNLLVLGLAITDFITAMVLIPFYCVLLSTSLANNVHINLIMNQIVFGLATVLLVASFYNVVAITMDRLLAIALHLRYQHLITCKKYSIVLACIWIGGLIAGSCRTPFRERKETRITFFALFFISTGVNIIFLVKISQAVRRHSAQIRSQEQSTQFNANIPRFKKSVKTMHLIIAAFVVCYSPYLLISALDALQDNDARKYSRIKVIAQTTLMANSLANPVIYCIRIDEIRKSVVRLFKT